MNLTMSTKQESPVVVRINKMGWVEVLPKRKKAQVENFKSPQCSAGHFCCTWLLHRTSAKSSNFRFYFKFLIIGRLFQGDPVSIPDSDNRKPANLITS